MKYNINTQITINSITIFHCFIMNNDFLHLLSNIVGLVLPIEIDCQSNQVIRYLI